uniref:Annexin n=1 Tax=Monopterus albus TaxID=43700 RepID=A0A3Q3K8R5_MONAL
MLFNLINDKINLQKETFLIGKPVFYGTVPPYPNFNASNDAAVLKSAIESKGVDEDVINAVLVKRNNEQRQKIKAVYEANAGKKLEVALKKALKSDHEDICLALLMPPAYYDAFLFRKATKVNISNVVDMAQAKKDAEALFEAGENTKGTNVSTFIDILTTRSGPQLAQTFQQYTSVSDNTFPKALEKEMKHDIKHCLMDIVKCAWNTPAFFAEKLHLAIKGLGTNEATLTRVLVSRSEVDLKKIVEEYRAMYGTSLQEHIVKDTSAYYQKILIGLCGAG